MFFPSGTHYICERNRESNIQAMVEEHYERYIYIKKFKKISKRNLLNVGMGGWMDALADKVHKQGEHIPQHCYISHNHPYISSGNCAT